MVKHIHTLTDDLDGRIMNDFPAYDVVAGEVVTFLDFETGHITAGPVSLTAIDVHSYRGLLSSSTQAKKGDLVVTGNPCGTKPFAADKEQ